MAEFKSTTRWVSGTQFESQLRNHKLITDTKVESGGQDQGPSPKEVLLASICACAGIDVVMILQKMRVALSSCVVDAVTETTSTQPSVFKHIKLVFNIQAHDIKPAQALRAVSLSMTKYCGVSAMVVNTSPMSYQVVLNEENIGTGVADFSGSSAVAVDESHD